MTDQRFSSEPSYTYTFGYSGNLLSTVTDPGAAQPNQGFVQSLVSGDLHSTYTDRRGATWIFVYDTTDEALKRTTNPLSHSWEFAYDTGRNRTLLRDPLLNEWGWTYDSKGNLLSATDPDFPLQPTTFSYDGLNNLTSITDATQVTTVLHYEHPENSTLLTSVEEPPLAPGGSVAATTIDYYWNNASQPNGEVSRITDPNNVVTMFTYDDWGQLSLYGEGEIDPQVAGGPSSAYLVQKYTNDYASRRTEYYRPSAPGAYTLLGSTNYNLLGNPISSSCGDPAAAGSWTPPIPSGFPTPPCNAIGDGWDQSAWLNEPEYDGMGRPKQLPLGLDFANEPSVDQKTLSYAYDELGVTQSATIATEEWDPNGSLQSRTFSYDYDLATGWATSTGPDGMESFSQFDAAGRLTYFRRGPSGSPVLSASIQYYADNTVDLITFGNNASTNYEYYDSRRVKKITHKDSTGAPILTLDYTYTPRGEIETIVENFGLSNQMAHAFSYDSRGRLDLECRDTIAACPSGATSNGIYNISYTYDDGGNRLTKVDAVADTRVEYHYDYENPTEYASNNNRLMYYESFDTSTAAPTLVSTTWYYYNAAGNPTRVVTGLATPPQGGPEFSAVKFIYARNGETVLYVLGESWDAGSGSCDENWGREFRYHSGRQRYLNREIDPVALQAGLPTPLPGGTVWSDYNGEEIYGDFSVSNSGGGPVFTAERSFDPGLGVVDPFQASGTSNSSYVLLNHLGTQRITTDGSGLAESQFVYTAFGERVCTSGCPPYAEKDRYGYVGAWGYQAHGEVSFLHIGARYYDPATGRFLQRDPIGIQGGVNVYSYVRSIPNRFVDPSGNILLTPMIQAFSALHKYNSQGCPWNPPKNDGRYCEQSSFYGFHGSADSCFREVNTCGGGSGGNQCCYKNGILMPDWNSDAGTRDTVAPATRRNANGMCEHGWLEAMGHTMIDVMGFGSLAE